MSSGDSASDTKTVRACDSCLRRKAWWYCAADDAFLCHTCDTSIHSANPLARRHERVRLRSPTSSTDDNEPTWHHSCKRKARSPRGPHRSASKPKDADEKGHEVIAVDPPETTVPDITDTPTPTEEEQLLYRVPIFDPVLSDFCSPPQSVAKQENPSIPSSTTLQTPVCSTATDLVLPTNINVEGLDMDVESLFGEALPKDAFALDFLSPVESHEDSGGYGRPFVPVKQEQELDENEGSSAVTTTFDLDMFDVCFDCKSEIEDKEEEKPQQKLTPTVAGGSVDKKRRRIMLSLNYEEVISAWSTQGCPWADGARPQLNLDDCWANFTESVVGAKVEGGGGEANVGAYRSGGGRLLSGRGLIPSEGREARVSRYREKRRTRLFSKKIRYEVRKLNAEKRPRMKGRFVKRPSFAPAASQTTQKQQQQQQQLVF